MKNGREFSCVNSAVGSRMRKGSVRPSLDDGEPLTYAYVWVDETCYSYAIDEEDACVGEFEFERMEGKNIPRVRFECPPDWR